MNALDAKLHNGLWLPPPSLTPMLKNVTHHVKQSTGIETQSGLGRPIPNLPAPTGTKQGRRVSEWPLIIPDLDTLYCTQERKLKFPNVHPTKVHLNRSVRNVWR